MLVDHRLMQQRRAADARRNRALVKIYGEFILDLKPWSWFITITFRNECSPDAAVAQVKQYLNELEALANDEFAWVMAKAFGQMSGRFHCHILTAGVDHLSIAFWKEEAIRRFGLSELWRFDDSLGAAHYLAGNGLDVAGDFEFGDSLADTATNRTASRPVGRVVIARSANVPSAFFHMTLRRRRKR